MAKAQSALPSVIWAFTSSRLPSASFTSKSGKAGSKYCFARAASWGSSA